MMSEQKLQWGGEPTISATINQFSKKTFLLSIERISSREICLKANKLDFTRCKHQIKVEAWWCEDSDISQILLF